MSSVSKNKRSQISGCKTLEDVIKVSQRKGGDLYASRSGTERDWKTIARGYQKAIMARDIEIRRLKAKLFNAGISYD